MQKIILSLLASVLPNLIEKILTKENIEKYSDKLFDICKKGVEHIQDEQVKGILNNIIDLLDEALGE